MSSTRRLFAILLAVAVLLVNGSVAALAENVLTLPSALRVIEEEAFEGDTSIDKVVLPEGVTAINARAFSDSTLSEINLPASLESIDDSAFDGPDQVAVTAQEGTYAYDWAVENGYIREPMAWPESSHPYVDNGSGSETWEYVSDDPKTVALKVTFSPLTAIENNCDFLYVIDSTGAERSYTGSALAGISLVLPGDRFGLRLEKDGSVGKWGFAFTDIVPMSQQEYDEYLADLAEHPYEVRVMGDGTVEITGYRGLDSVIEIPAEIDGAAVTGISVRAFAGNATITEVTIPDSVTVIRSSAFYNCPNLTKVVIPGSVKKIGSQAFYSCDSLSDVTLGEGIETIEYGAFAYTESLTEITLPASLTYIAYEAFEESALETVHATPGTYAYTWAVDHGYITPEGSLVILPYLDDGVFTDSGDTLLWDLLGGNYNSDLQIIVKVSADTTVEWSADWIIVRDHEWNEVESGTSFITPEAHRMNLELDYNMTGETRQADFVFTCGEITRTLTIRQLPFMFADLVAPDDLDIDYSYYDGEGSPTRVFYALGDLNFAWNTVDGAVDYAYGLRTPSVYEDSGDTASFTPITGDDIQDGVIRVTIPADALEPTNRMDHSVVLRMTDQYGHEYDTRYKFGIYDPASPEWGYRNHYTWDEDTDEDVVDGLTITGYSGSSTTPVVPSEIGGQTVVCLEGTFEEDKTITGITLPDTVYEIGDYTFGSCENLQSITLPSGVTWLGYGAFSGCSGLTEFTFPSGVTYIADSVLAGCAGLTEITIPDGATSIEYDAFRGCTSLTEITIPGSVEYIEGNAFSDCFGLQTLTVLEGVQRINGYAFEGCSSLAKITMPASVNYISDDAFIRCTGVTEYIAPEGSYAYNYGIEQGFIHEDYVFESAHPITGNDDLNYSYTYETEADGLKLTFSVRTRFSGLSLSYDGNSDSYSGDWQGKNGLQGKTVVIPGNHFDISLSDDGNERWGFGITAIEPMTAAEITAWKDAHPFIYQNYSFWDPNTYTNINGIEITKYQGTATEVVVPATIDGKQVLRVGGSTFTSRSDLTSVVVSEGVLALDPYAFSYCSALTSVTLPGSITQINGDTIYDSPTVIITAPEGSYAYNWAMENGYGNEPAVLESTHPFYSDENVNYDYSGPAGAEMLKVTFSKRCYLCNGLSLTLSDDSVRYYYSNELAGKTLYLPGDHFMISLFSVPEGSNPYFGFRITDVTPMSVAEYETYRAEHPFVVKPWGDDVTIVDYIGTDTNLVIPEYYEGKHVVHISPRAFYRHDELTSVVIPESVTGISSDAFDNCSNLVSVTLPSGIWDISNDVFYNCASLTEVNIPDNVHYIYDYAFGYCASLTSIELSANVEYIDVYAFYNCPNLTITAPEGSYAYNWAQTHGFVAEPAVLESAHPFKPESESGETFSYTHDTDAEALKLTFSTRTQFDSMTLTDAQGSSTEYNGTSLSGQEVIVPGNSFTINMVNWGENFNFGFRITAIEALTQEEYDAWRAEHPFITRSYNWDSVTIAGYVGTDTDLVIPEYIGDKQVKWIGDSAFANHTELTSVVIPDCVDGTDGGVFRGCTGLERVVLPSGMFNIWYNMFEGCTSLTDVNIPGSVQWIYDRAFFGCTSLTSIYLPDSVCGIDDTVFDGCTNLTITAPEGSYAWNWAQEHGFISDEEAAILESAHPYTPETEHVFNYSDDESTAGMLVTFSQDTEFKSLWITDNYDNERNYEGSGLKSQTVFIPGNHFTLQLDGSSSGYYGFSITQVEPLNEAEYADYVAQHPFLTQPYMNGVEIRNYLGTGTDLVFPEEIDGLPVRCVRPNRFTNKNATSMVIPSSIDYLYESSFQGFEQLISVSLPTIYRIESNVFNGCISLEYVNIPSQVWYIGSHAFAGCTSLTSLTLSENVEEIEDNAFEGCTNLTITAPEGSYAYGWAQDHNIPVVAEPTTTPEPLPGTIG